MESKHFIIQELVDPKTYELYGERAWEFIDDRLIKTIDTLKEHFNLGTMSINNYKWNKDREWSGLRTPESPYYNPYSQHSYGRAIDAIFSHYTAQEVRNYIIGNQDQFPYITAIELDVSWLHVDVRNTEKIKLFKP